MPRKILVNGSLCLSHGIIKANGSTVSQKILVARKASHNVKLNEIRMNVSIHKQRN